MTAFADRDVSAPDASAPDAAAIAARIKAAIEAGRAAAEGAPAATT